jgi:hypothetical protein
MKRKYRVLSAFVGAICAAGALAVPVAAAINPASDGGKTVAGHNAPAAPQDKNRSTLTGSGLSVSPANALFDVVLAPGDNETRHVTLTNSGSTALDVTLTANVVSTDGAGAAAEHLHLSSSTGATCPIEDSPRARVLAKESVPQGRIAAGESQQVCIAVGLGPDAKGMAATSTRAHLEFDAIERPGQQGQLAYTGADLASLLLAAAAVLFVGLALLRDRPRQSLSQMSSPSPTNRGTDTELP